jgi:sec-independent protein translocase protein TatC
MTTTEETTESSMSILEHLDELRSRMFRTLIVFVVVLSVCWAFSEYILEFLLVPIRRHLIEGDEIVFITPVEPFMTYMKAAAILAIFVTAPYILYQVWAFVAPGLYKNERRMVIPFLFFGTLFFVAGGAFGYYVATPIASGWLIGLGKNFTAQITLRSAFQFESRVILAMGLVFELPVLMGFLMRHFRTAVLIIAVLAAVLTPTGDMLTMSVFAGPMILLYLLGVSVSWLVLRKPVSRKDS